MTGIDVGYRRLELRMGPVRIPLRVRSVVVGAAALVAVLVLTVLSLGWGTYTVAPDAVIRALLGSGDAMDTTVVVGWRLPRTLAAVSIGALLAIAGALFQTVTRNPLASPDILGLSNGAFTGMLVTLVLVSASWPARAVGALVGCLAASAVIWLLASRGGVQGFRLIVVGIGVSAMLASLNTWMLLQIELETAMFASSWGQGSLNGVTGDALAGVLACVTPFAVAAFALVPALRQIELGDDVAAASGVRPPLVRALALLVGVVLVAATTAIAGPVAFVALAAPQIARRLAGSPTLSLALSAVVGSLLLLASDLVAQHLLPVPLPVGVVTVSVGGLYLIVVIVSEIRHRV
ncbi:iron-enterobactin transporter permease [Cnuibacter physcomitrellae]|uniref:Iron ABC transporter permease n=1 Tax=Cnuibacter physcomitrellae TaxID=1619308 RepID=A0A1X9LF81_9MICO|nr:iron chelate uptake ABC transporter family permease subunit [Cnuibacter physcomitrellae]ARJ03845.1 iron ABC transporter permease [Cnuibacter physcomitrellae]GGI39636.1 iron-enterobactin transporter permease [Cnuibacter physcomitrellae]